MIAIGYISLFLVGIVLGLLGGGGSILSVPVLVYLFEIPASLATVYSLFLVGTSSFVGSLSYLAKKLIDLKTGLIFLLPSMLGVWLSRRLLLPALPAEIFNAEAFTLTKDRLILLVFAVVMGLASYSMLRSRVIKKEELLTPTKRGFLPIGMMGLGAGVLMGFVGAGGGFLIIPVLTSYGRLDMKMAIGTSLFIITLSSLFGFVSDLLGGIKIDWTVLGLFSVLSIAGVLVGARFSTHVSSAKLKKGFGFLVLAIAFIIVIKEVFFG